MSKIPEPRAYAPTAPDEAFIRPYHDNPVRFAVVGLGMGRFRAKQLTQTSGTRLLGVCDINLEKARAVGEELGVPYASDIARFLNDPDVEVMYVVTPSGSHCDVSIACLEAGKHVLVTKPMDAEAGICGRAIEVARAKRLQFGLDFDVRVTRWYLEMKKAVDEGWFGDMLGMHSALYTSRDDAYFLANGGWRGTWRWDGGGALSNQGVHELDRVYAMLGVPERVSGSIRTRTHNIETEDVAMSQWAYAGGCVASFCATTSHPAKGWRVRVEMFGTKGACLLTSGGPEGDSLRWCEKGGAWSDTAPFPQAERFRQGSDAFAYSLRTGEPLLMTGEEGRMSRVILDAIYDSARNHGGNWVTVPK